MFKRIKILLYPLKFASKEFYFYLGCQIFDGFQSVFIIQILAFIVGAIQAKNLEIFYNWLFVFVCLEILAYILLILNNYFFAKTYHLTSSRVFYQYLRKFINLDNNKIESLGTGRSGSIIMKGVDNRVDISLGYLMDVIIGVFSIVYSFGIIFYSAGYLYFLGFFGVSVLMFLIAYFGNKKTFDYRRPRKDCEVEFDRGVIKIIMSKFEILQNNRFSDEVIKFKKIIKNIEKLKVPEELFTSVWNIGIKFLSDLLKILVFLVLGLGVIKGQVKLSHFILIYGLVDVTERYIWGFVKQIRSIAAKLIHVDKLLETFDSIDEIKGINNTTSFVYKKGNIKVNSLNFGYCEDNIFNNFSVELVGGTKTALVGDSGSGKTTLMKLLAGYLHPKSGDIIVDNQNISEVNLISYYKNIGYLTQEPSVFDGTIMENLTYALDREPTQAEINKTVKESKCEFIYDFPNGMETEIGERGIKLSGGQKQRLAIAKIMLKNPNIILLDEPTSALDSISEQVVSEALHNLFKGRTVVVIAHRLQTVKEADDIIVLKKGKIIERGNHKSLSKIEDGEYKKMLDLQTSF